MFANTLKDPGVKPLKFYRLTKIWNIYIYIIYNNIYNNVIIYNNIYNI